MISTPSRWPHPIFVRLQDVPVAVVGGGPVAERKIAALVEGGARVVVVSPEVTPGIAEWAAKGLISLKRRRYQAGDLRGARLAYAATSSPDVSRAVRIEARAEGIWLNAVDQPELCDFISPALVRRGDLTIAISTNGRAPGFARRMREELERQFGPEFAERVEQAALERRARIAEAGPGRCPGRVEEGTRAQDATYGQEAGRDNREPGPGCVYLVGAGPGDPDLLTVKGRRLLERAGCVVYDALVSSALLELCPADTELVYVGKRDNRHTLPQAEINAVLVDRARAGTMVVRLKGGDPFIFGRGGEEAEALVEAGVPFEVVPGVSAGVAVPAYAGIPLTHRQFTSELVFVTGHECTGTRSPVDWARYARSAASLVIFMGVHNLANIARALLDHGRDPGCPVAVIENGTTEAQRTIVGPLVAIAERVAAAGIVPPALIVIGEVVAMRDTLHWFER